jgi:hypothetical protein
MDEETQEDRRDRLRERVNLRLEQDRQRKLDNQYAQGRKNEDAYMGVEMDVGAVHRGVSVSWLSQVFDKNPATIKKLLADCPPLHRRKAGYIYDLKQAASYLITPNVDVNKLIQSMRPEDLPVKLQDKYWAAKSRRLKYEENAGHLWRTERVQFVVGEMFQSIKFAIQLWADRIDRQVGLTSEQRAILYGMADDLQDQIYLKVSKLSSESATPSVLGEDPDEEEDEDDPLG